MGSQFSCTTHSQRTDRRTGTQKRKNIIKTDKSYKTSSDIMCKTVIICLAIVACFSMVLAQTTTPQTCANAPSLNFNNTDVSEGNIMSIIIRESGRRNHVGLRPTKLEKIFTMRG